MKHIPVPKSWTERFGVGGILAKTLAEWAQPCANCAHYYGHHNGFRVCCHPGCKENGGRCGTAYETGPLAPGEGFFAQAEDDALALLAEELGI